MKRELLTTISIFKQKSNIPGEGMDNLLRWFLVIRRVSLLVLLITIALLLVFVLVNLFIGLLVALPLVFIIIRWVYRQLKDTNIPLYVITLASILPVAVVIHLYNVFHPDIADLSNFILEISIAIAVFALALFLTSLGHLYYQITIMTKYRQTISISMLASTVVAAIIVIPLTIMVTAVMMRAARGDEDFLFVPFAVIFDVIKKAISIVSTCFGV